MAATIPTCAVLTPAGALSADHFTSFYTWISANPGNFTLSNITGTPVTSFTLTHTDSWQLNFRLSSNIAYCMIAPDGGISNSATPGTPTGYTESIAFPLIATGSGARNWIARYEDAIFFGIAHTDLSYMTYAFMAGSIGQPLQAQDVANKIDGLGILANIPTNSPSGSSGYWFSTISTAAARQSRVRSGATSWCIGVTYQGSAYNISQSSSTRRFSPIMLTGDPTGVNAPGSASPNICMTKYVYFAGGVSDASSPFSLNESASTNQAMLTINNASSTSRMRILWDKTVDPTP